MGWAADIVLEERLTPDTLANIRLNKDNPYKANNDGDMMLNAANALQRLADDQRPSGEELINWLVQKTGISPSQGPRMKTILTHQQYSHFATRVVRTSWGRRDFVIEHFDKLCTQHVARVSAPPINGR